MYIYSNISLDASILFICMGVYSWSCLIIASSDNTECIFVCLVCAFKLHDILHVRSKFGSLYVYFSYLPKLRIKYSYFERYCNLRYKGQRLWLIVVELRDGHVKLAYTDDFNNFMDFNSDSTS